MTFAEQLVLFILLVGAAAFLFIWKRRDAGLEPADGLAEALDERLDGRSPPRSHG